MGESIVWPSFYIVGAMKCGTSSLYAYLKKHPMAFLSEMKEPHYFLSHLTSPSGNGCITKDDNCIGDESKYRDLFRDADQSKAIGDASTSYLCDESAAGNIHAVRPDARIIIILRDPVERAHSHYQMDVQMGKERRPFLQALKQDYAAQTKGWGVTHLYVDAGIYTGQIEHYFATFGREQVLVLLFDELKSNPRSAVLKVTRHIGVDPISFDPAEHSHAYNAYRRPKFPTLQRIVAKSKASKLLPQGLRRSLRYSPLLFDTRSPSMDDESRRYLQRIFAPDILRLEELLGKKLPELRKSWV
jgi:hypothetical protein